MSICPWKVRWTTGQDAACDLEEHLTGRRMHNDDGVEVQVAEPSEVHHATVRNYAYPGSVTELQWLAGDRREFTGEWPGPCRKLDYDPGSGARTEQMAAGCTLHAGHHGRCAP